MGSCKLSEHGFYAYLFHRYGGYNPKIHDHEPFVLELGALSLPSPCPPILVVHRNAIVQQFRLPPQSMAEKGQERTGMGAFTAGARGLGGMGAATVLRLWQRVGNAHRGRRIWQSK